MAHVVTETATPARWEGSLVGWGAVFAGAVLAAAISFVLLTFGTAIGLSATSPWPNSGLPAGIIVSLAVFWALAQQIGAFLAGGYVAGRMRTPSSRLRTDEVQFLDGLHGGLVWAVGIVIGAALALAAAGAIARTGAELSGKAAVAVTSTAEPMELALDAMLRQTARGAPSGRVEDRAELARILTSSVATGPLSDQNRAYLAQRVSQLTGVSQQDAEARVNEALNATRRAADKARRAAVLTGFVTAASLVISFAAAWWAAVKGGQHRDNPLPAMSDRGQERRRPTAGT